MRLFCTTLLLVVALSSGVVRASVTYWEQHWQQPGKTDWQPIGLLATGADESGKPQLQFLTFTYIARDIVTPESVRNVQVDDAAVRFQGDFGEREQPDGSKQRIEIDFDLKRSDANMLEGSATLAGKEVGRTKLVRIDGPAKLMQRLEQIRDLLDLEIAICQGQIPPMRDSVKFWLRQLDEDRKMGRATTGTQTRLSLTVAESVLGTEEARLTGLEMKRMALIEAMEKLKRAAP